MILPWGISLGLGLMQATHAEMIMDVIQIDMVDYVVVDGDLKNEDGSKLFPKLVSSFLTTLQGT